jgi:acetylornithine deacetylase/succinyl-diaminopimelate desuccinylase-like protein
MHDKLLKAVERRVDDLVELTADLIRFPTINPARPIRPAPNLSVRA